MPDNCPQVREDLISQDLVSEVMLYDSRNGSAHVLNSTAAVIFTLCDGKHSVEEMAEEVRNRFELKPDSDILRDIKGFLDKFQEKGFFREPS